MRICIHWLLFRSYQLYFESSKKSFKSCRAESLQKGAFPGAFSCKIQLLIDRYRVIRSTFYFQTISRQLLCFHNGDDDLKIKAESELKFSFSFIIQCFTE